MKYVLSSKAEKEISFLYRGGKGKKIVFKHDTPVEIKNVDLVYGLSQKIKMGLIIELKDVSSTFEAIVKSKKPKTKKIRLVEPKPKKKNLKKLIRLCD